jgi:hypothetical protein
MAAVIAVLVLSFGCKKKESQPADLDLTTVQTQAQEAGDQAAKDAEAAKQEAGKAIEKTGTELQK